MQITADKIAANRAYYGDVERGTRNLTMRSLHRVAEGLGVQVQELFKESEASRSQASTRRSKAQRK
jgi:transcriptional regulator with XRE-family HTH domain